MTKNKHKHGIVKGILITRKNLVEMIVVAVLLSFGVNLIASQIITFTIFSPIMAILLGVILCLISVSYLIVRLFGKRRESRTYKAFLIYNKKTNEIVPVPRYEFSEEIYQYFRCAFAENPALKTLWEKEPLKNILLNNGDNFKLRKSVNLLLEAVEYFVLDKLSIHSTDYFNTKSLKEENLEEYSREDIPDVLLRNRFLELFSRPMEDRPAFVNEIFSEDKDEEVVYVVDPDGYMYNKFELILPKNSTVRRLKDNKIEIETNKLKMTITVRFDGTNTDLPDGFVLSGNYFASCSYLLISPCHKISEYNWL